MSTWWTSSPYYNIGIYFGGANRGCAQPNLTSSWITSVQTSPQRWGLLPIWFGAQMPNPYCQTDSAWSTYISTNSTTAYNQGWSEAASAYSAASNLGFDVAGMPILYDLEGYGNGNGNISVCRSAAKAFINGWVPYLHTGISQKAGVYGSQCGSYVQDFASITNVPDFVWFADWDSQPSVTRVAAGCALTGWTNSQRHKQYVGQHYETYGGVRIFVDNDCSNGPVYLSTDFRDAYSKCL